MEIKGPGIYKGVHNDTYRAINAVSYSDLKAWVSGSTFKASPAMNIGSAVHAIILEPETAADEFVTYKDNVDRRKTKSKEYLEYAAFCDDTDKTVLLPKEREEVKLLVNVIKGTPEAMRIIEAEGDNEISVVTQLPGHTALSKCRIDMDRRNVTWDLKTTGYADRAGFEDAIYKYDYDGQGTYYPDILANENKEQPKAFGWICVSKTSLDCWVTEMAPQHYVTGKRWYENNLKLWERYGKK